MTKIALIAFDWGEYSIRLSSALAEHAEVALLLDERQAAPHLQRLDARVRYHAIRKPRLRQPLRQLQMIRRLQRVLAEFRPDVVHLQHGHFWFNLALPFLRRYPLVITIHDPRIHLGDAATQRTPQWLYDFGFRQARQVIVHTQQAAQIVETELHIPARRIHIVPHLLLGDDSEQAHVEEAGNQILFFGRIWPYKGLAHLIRAEPLITASVPDAQIVIAGRGENFTRYRQLMVHPERFVVHNEYISNDKRSELFRRASVIVLPYVEATQSGVVPLAYTFGKPVVATRVGGLPEQVEHAQTGYLVPPRDEQALANAIISLLQDRALRRRLGANGKRKLEREWSAEVIARQTLPVYERAVAEAPTRAQRSAAARALAAPKEQRGRSR